MLRLTVPVRHAVFFRLVDGRGADFVLEPLSCVRVASPVPISAADRLQSLEDHVAFDLLNVVGGVRGGANVAQMIL